MKLIVQIPCLNEESTLPQTVSDVPQQIKGIDTIEVMVVDDGSTDGTAEVARELGVDHVVQIGTNRGLATAFKRGVAYALAQGADIVVNTDADNQYRGEDIAKLVQPIVQDHADIVVGCRPIREHPEFSPLKKLLQIVGSCVLRNLSKTTVRDAPSGFRAFSRESCLRIFLHSRFSYCMETLIQAGNSGLRVASVDIRVNPKTRDSRLFASTTEYLSKSGGTMLKIFILHRPAAFFFGVGSLFLAVALFLGIRFLYLIYWTQESDMERTYLPSLILLAVMATTSAVVFALGVIGDLLRSQRLVTEELLYLQRHAMCPSQGDRTESK